jgi:hypothetical protein
VFHVSCIVTRHLLLHYHRQLGPIEAIRSDYLAHVSTCPMCISTTGGCLRAPHLTDSQPRQIDYARLVTGTDVHMANLLSDSNRNKLALNNEEVLNCSPARG